MKLSAAQKKELTFLRRNIPKWRDAYTNSAKPMISDEEYDEAEERLAELSPDDPLLKQVGSPVRAGKGRPRKVKLKLAMPSLGKIKPGKGAEAYISENPTFTVSDKLDGVSASYLRDGMTYKLYSRGNGLVGQDISHLIGVIQGLGKLKPDEAVRGEIIIPNKTFKAKHGDDYDNPRNLTSGIINSGKVHKAAKSAVFIAYEQMKPRKPLKEAAAGLKQRGFKVVPHKTIRRATLEKLMEFHQERKTKAQYDIDGIVCDTGMDPVAFKMDAEAVKAEVKEIAWKLSKHGVYKPTIVLEKAVRISGVSIKRVTGHNARMLIKLGIGPKATIKIIRSGDVIPKVVGVVKKTKPTFPKGVKWDANKVNIVPKTLSRSQGRVKTIRQMVTALSVFGIEGVKEANMSKIYDGGLTSLPMLLAASLQTLEATGLGRVYSAKLHKSLKRVLPKVTHAQMWQASGLLPTGFTQTRLKPLNQLKTYRTLSRASKPKLVKFIAQQPMWSAKTATQFADFLPKYESFLEELHFTPKNEVTPRTVTGKFSGMTFVFTGFRDADMQNQIERLGGKVKSSVSSTTTAVVSNSTSMTGKVKAAHDKGIPIFTVQDFREAYKL